MAIKSKKKSILSLPRRLIRMFSFANDTVLDPFLGSGTTCLAAKNPGRNSIGYEINNDFLPVIKSKLKGGIKTVQQGKSGIEIDYSEFL
jgi:site-specific DNA-methyltransferase (adenine-specific)